MMLHRKPTLMLFLCCVFADGASAEDYKLPFAGGSRWQCTQGNNEPNSKSTHWQGGKLRFAYDLAPREGDRETIVAMKSGVVVAVFDRVEAQATSSEERFGNYVTIRNVDGAYDHYAHLTIHTFLVREGEQVWQGQPLARVGSTGVSTGPHIHVHQTSTASISDQSQRFSFSDRDTARHDGRPRTGFLYRSDNYFTLTEFTFPNHASQGWRCAHNTEISHGRDINTWQVHVTGPDPRIVSAPFMPGMNASQFILHFSARVLGNDSPANGLIYLRDENGNWNPVSIGTVDTSHDYREYRVDLSATSVPQDLELRQIRIDFTDGNNGDDEYWSLDWFKILSRYYYWDFADRQLGWTVRQHARFADFYAGEWWRMEATGKRPQVVSPYLDNISSDFSKIGILYSVRGSGDGATTRVYFDTGAGFGAGCFSESSIVRDGKAKSVVFEIPSCARGNVRRVMFDLFNDDDYENKLIAINKIAFLRGDASDDPDFRIPGGPAATPIVEPPPENIPGPAWSWEHPIWPYSPGSYDGRSFYYDHDHLGEDIELAEGEAVRAIGDGVIRYYGASSEYGELVVVIEHDLGRQYVFRNAHGGIVRTQYILSIYGHLRKSRYRGEPGLTFHVGEFVHRGNVIGYVNDDAHNGHGSEHLHLGIRLSNAQTAISRDPSAWYRGYERNTTFGTDFAAASEVLQILQHVGRYGDSRQAGSWRNDGSSQAFLNAYNRHDGPVKLGFPFDNGGSVYVHQWPDDDPIHNVLIQDFKNDDPATRYGTDGQTALIYNRGMNKAFLLKEGMWGLYKPPKADLPAKYSEYLYGLFGPHDLGAPKTGEYRDETTNEVVQEFDRGELRFSRSQNEWTITWYNDAPSPRRPRQPYRIIPQWEQVSGLGFNALVSSTLIQQFLIKIIPTGGVAKFPGWSRDRSAGLLANESIELSWEIESPPPGGTIDFLYSETGERPFTHEIVTGLQATTSGSFRWVVPPTIGPTVWIQMIVKDRDGMIVESETSVFSIVRPPAPTPTFTPTPTNTPVPPTPTNTPTPKTLAPLSGTVTDISTGRPIANAILSIQGGPTTATNPKGEFEFQTLSPGVYDITVSKTGYQTATFVNVIILPGQPTVLTIELTTPGLLNIETTALPAAEVGLPYNPKVRVTGGTPPYSYLVASGSLPDGLFLGFDTGNITGTPTASGSFTFAIGVRDKLGAYAEQQFTLVVTEPLTIETTSPLPHGTKGIDYFVSLQVSGGVPPYSFLGPEAPPFPESAHPYRNHTYQTWTYVAPLSPNEIRVTFDIRTEVERGYDYIYIRDGQGNNVPGSPFTGTELSGRTVTVPGSKVIITLRSDGSITRWGMKVTSISPAHPAGSLPPGLTLDSAGNLKGIPAQSGAYSFTIFVADAEGRTVEKQFNVEFFDPLIISTERLSDGIVGKVYNQRLEATGGEGRLRWEVYSGILPLGLSLDSQSGMLLGTPLEQTYGTIVFAVADSQGRITYKDFTLKVSDPLTLQVTSLPDALVGEPYSELIRFSGGWEPYTFTIDGQLPDGLSLDPTSGIISGVPTSPQFRNFSVTLSDSSYPTTQAVTKVLNIRVTSELTITTSAVMPNAKKGAAVNPVVLTAKGGPSPYRWDLISGILPAGITFDGQNGILAGAPTSKGDYVFTIRAVDAAGASTEKEFFWHVSDDLTITTAVLADAAKGVEYKYSLEAKGGIPPYTWRLKSGTLPDGLTFDSNGTISGRPTKRQTFSFTVEVNDSDSPAQTAQQTYIIDVRDTMFIVTRSVPNCRVDKAYTATIRAELGVRPYVWSLESGVLPPGIQLVSTPTAARLEGTPIEPGTYTFTIQVSDSGTPVQTRSFEYTMEVYGKLDIETAQLKSAFTGVPYSENLIATGGRLPYVWRIVDGALPKGLYLNQSTGHISGITSLGVGQSSEFTVRVIDSGIPSGFDEKQLVIKVIEGIEIVTFAIPKALQHVSFIATLEGQGGISPYHWSVVSGRLPDGIVLDTGTGVLSGTPLEFGRFEFVVQMTDSSDPQYSDTRAYIWEIIENPVVPTPVPTPTPLPTPVPGSIDLGSLSAYPVTGFDLASSVEQGLVPTDNAYAGATDGEGLIVSLEPGQGVFLQLEGLVEPVDPMVELSVAARSTTDAVQMALVAIAYPVDGSLGYVNPTGSEVPVHRWGKLRLVYESPTSQIIPAVQLVLPAGTSPGTVATVYLDSLAVYSHTPAGTQRIQLTSDGTFDSITPDLAGLNANLFLPEGAEPGFVLLTGGLSGQGIRLELLPGRLAAHVALFSVPPPMPTMIHGSAWVRRESGEDAMVALVITDGEQSVGYFLKTRHLPVAQFKQIRVAGNFETGQKDLPPILVLQLGGPNVSGSIIIDEVELATTHP